MPYIFFRLATDIQAEATPLILGGGDVLMAAETGSGKTGAFCLPVLQIVHESRRNTTSGATAGEGGGEQATKKAKRTCYSQRRSRLFRDSIL